VAQKEADKLRLELSTLKPQLTAANSKVAELQAANAALRVSVNDLKQRLLLAADGVPVGMPAGQTASQQQQAGGVDAVTKLQQQLARSEAEAAQLKQQLAAMERQVVHSARGGGDSDQLQSLQQQVAVLQQENQELRQELGAFDPAFFEELEDLKHSHHQLQQKAVAQAKLIRQLQNQLSNSGCSQQLRPSGIGPEGSSGSGVGGRSARLAP
jgi:predicted  nucleic acid-binding Zn-ribbon protein